MIENTLSLFGLDGVECIVGGGCCLSGDLDCVIKSVIFLCPGVIVSRSNGELPTEPPEDTLLWVELCDSSLSLSDSVLGRVTRWSKFLEPLRLFPIVSSWPLGFELLETVG